jgi:hypothetical protein
MKTTVQLWSPVTGHDRIFTQLGSSCEDCGPRNALHFFVLQGIQVTVKHFLCDDFLRSKPFGRNWHGNIHSMTIKTLYIF